MIQLTSEVNSIATTSTISSASAIEVTPSQVVRIRKAIKRDEGRHHEHVAMGEVHHADDAEHHGVADGDQAVDRAERDAVNELLEENFHALGSSLSVAARLTANVPRFKA